MFFDVYVSGVLAWRKLLMNSKPDARFSTNHYRAYYKKGDFSDALNDFLSVVPNARKSTNSEKLVCYFSLLACFITK